MNPKTAYIAHWFPKPTETFIFREIDTVLRLGLPVRVYTLYGELKNHLSSEMADWEGRVERAGVGGIRVALSGIGRWRERKPDMVNRIFGRLRSQCPWDIEKWAENWWAGFMSFHLAGRFLDTGIRHIHAPWASGPATAAWTASLLTGIPFSFTARAHDIFPPDDFLADKIKAASFIRSPNEYNTRHLMSVSDEAASKTHLIYNGLTMENKPPAEVRLRTPIQLLAVGRLVEKKGFQYLIGACRILRESGFDFHLVLAGDGPLKARLMRLTQRYGLSACISFSGFVPFDRISEFYSRADIFIMPSIVDSAGDRDGIPNVILEALMHRLPVVASNVSAIPEVIQDGDTGLLVQPHSPHGLTRAILEMARNRKKAVAMAGRGRERIRRRFDPGRNFSNIIELFRKHAEHRPM